MMRVDNKSEKSLGELFSELSSGFSTMFRQELALAKAEVAESFRHAIKDIILIAIGGFVLYTALYVFIAAAILGLAEVVPVWLSAIIIGVVLSILGYILIQKGLKHLKSHQFKPEQAIESLKEDKEWVRAKI